MTDKITSAFVPYQLPANIRDNDPLFVEFLQAYYEWMEQASGNNITSAPYGNVIDVAHNLRSFIDIDTTLPAFANVLYNEFMQIFPTGTVANKATLLKNIKQFYTARGSQNSYRFLMRALFNQEIDIQYPGQQILIASSGTWILQQLLLVNTVTVNGVVNNTLPGLEYFVNTSVTGQESGATASVESVFITFENDLQQFQLYVSSVVGEFIPGEEITTVDVYGNVLTATLNLGAIIGIEVIEGGSGYQVNEIVPIESTSGNLAVAYISSVTTGNLAGIQLIFGGAGFLLDDPVGVYTVGQGFGANGFVSQVSANNEFHPNTYIINSDVIQPYLNVALNATSYGFPANEESNLFATLANSFSFFSYGPTGPAALITLFAGGSDYSAPPSANISGNTIVKALGILGRMNLVSGGTGYANGELLVFTNVPGACGYGANGNVVVNATGTIIDVQFTSIGDQWPIGGLGYQDGLLPTISIDTVAGTGGNVVCICTLASGDLESVNTSTIGTILAITVAAGGNGYTIYDTSVNLAGFGSGTANAIPEISEAIQTQAGRFLDDTGFLSSAFYLEDSDYYMNYAYVIRLAQSITKYQSIVKQLLHPAGTILWGEYLYNDVVANLSLDVSNTSNIMQYGFYNVETTYIPATSNIYPEAASMEATPVNSAPVVTGTFSMWFNVNYMEVVNGYVVPLIDYASPASNGDVLQVSLGTNYSTNSSPYYIQILSTIGNENTIMNITSNVQDVIQPNAWNHIVASWDLGNGNSWLYLNNTLSQNVITFVKSANSKPNTNTTTVYIIRSTVGEYFVGDLSEVYYSNQYINLSNVTNRQMFISNDYLPVYLGPTGNTPTGSPALIYLNQPWYNFGNNQGVGTKSPGFSNLGPLMPGNSSPVPY